MALTPEGTPYVESTDLVANYPAASLSLANRVDLVGVLPFVDSAARATAIPSPTDGQYSYLQDTNSTEFWNGSSWVAAGVAPGLVHINTATFSASSAVNINSVFSATYENYRVIINITDASPTNQAVLMRLRASGSDNSTSNYVTNELYQTSTTVAGRVNFTGNDDWYLGIVDATVDDRYSANLDVFAPQAATNTKALFDSTSAASTGDYYQNRHALFFNAATQFDGFSVFLASGTFTGTIRTYGYKNS